MSTADVAVVQSQNNVKEQDSVKEQLTAKQQMIDSAKSVSIAVVCVLAAIIIFGSWGYAMDVVSLDRSSIWTPCLLGLSAATIGAWAICSISNSVKSAALTALAVLCVYVWLICFSAANSLVFDFEYPELTGFVWWTYLSLWVPMFAAFIGLMSLRDDS